MDERYFAAIERVLEKDTVFIEQHLALLAAARAVVAWLDAACTDCVDEVYFYHGDEADGLKPLADALRAAVELAAAEA
jgi:hypothetical protein